MLVGFGSGSLLQNFADSTKKATGKKKIKVKEHIMQDVDVWSSSLRSLISSLAAVSHLPMKHWIYFQWLFFPRSFPASPPSPHVPLSCLEPTSLPDI